MANTPKRFIKGATFMGFTLPFDKTVNFLVCENEAVFIPRPNLPRSEFNLEFSGELLVNSLLTLKATAKISGDVIISKLSVEPGAEFNASCAMKGSVKELNNGKAKQEKTA